MYLWTTANICGIKNIDNHNEYLYIQICSYVHSKIRRLSCHQYRQVWQIHHRWKALGLMFCCEKGNYTQTYQATMLYIVYQSWNRRLKQCFFQSLKFGEKKKAVLFKAFLHVSPWHRSFVRKLRISSARKTVRSVWPKRSLKISIELIDASHASNEPRNKTHKNLLFSILLVF